MANRYFDVTLVGGGMNDGSKKLNTGSSGVYRGMLAGWPSGGSLGTSTGSLPYGQFNDYMRLEEHPTSDDLGTYLSGKEVNVVTGRFITVVGPDLFTAGSIPSVGDNLYPGVAGLLDTNENWPTVKSIGRVTAVVSVADVDGAGAFNAAECLMDFPSLGAA